MLDCRLYVLGSFIDCLKHSDGSSTGGTSNHRISEVTDPVTNMPSCFIKYAVKIKFAGYKMVLDSTMAFNNRKY